MISALPLTTSLRAALGLLDDILQVLLQLSRDSLGVEVGLGLLSWQERVGIIPCYGERTTRPWSVAYPFSYGRESWEGRWAASDKGSRLTDVELGVDQPRLHVLVVVLELPIVPDRRTGPGRRRGRAEGLLRLRWWLAEGLAGRVRRAGRLLRMWLTATVVHVGVIGGGWGGGFVWVSFMMLCYETKWDLCAPREIWLNIWEGEKNWKEL